MASCFYRNPIFTYDQTSSSSYTETTAAAAAAAAMSMLWGNDSRVSFEKLLDSKLYSDLTMVCDGKEFSVHKAIVCTQSPVLAAACNGHFKEASENVIHVKEFDADTLYRMLEFLYTGEYTAKSTEHVNYDMASASFSSSSHKQDDTVTPDRDDHDGNNHNDNNDDGNSPSFNTTENPEPDFSEWMGDSQQKADALLDMLQPHIGTNAIGDYYDIPGLRQRANIMISSVLHDSWSAMGFIPAVQQIFQVSGDKDLHAIVAETAVKHLHELVNLEEFANMRDMPSEFGIAVIQQAAWKLDETEDKLAWTEAEHQNLRNEFELCGRNYSDECDSLQRSLVRVESTIEKLQHFTHCRHCSAAFNAVVRERYRPGSASTYTIRCRQCSTKH